MKLIDTISIYLSSAMPLECLPGKRTYIDQFLHYSISFQTSDYIVVNGACPRNRILPKTLLVAVGDQKGSAHVGSVVKPLEMDCRLEIALSLRAELPPRFRYYLSEAINRNTRSVSVSGSQFSMVSNDSSYSFSYFAIIKYKQDIILTSVNARIVVFVENRGGHSR